MKESRKENSIALVSRKEVMKHFTNLYISDQGENSDEDLIDGLIASVSLIIRRYEESTLNGSRRSQFKGDNSTRRSISKKKKNQITALTVESLTIFLEITKRTKKLKVLRTMKGCIKSY